MKGQTDTFKLIVTSKPLDKNYFDIDIKMSADCTHDQIVKCIVAIIHVFENNVPECWGFALDRVMKEKDI